MLGIAASTRPVGDARPFDVVFLDALGNPVFGLDPSRPANAAVTSVPASATEVQILAANPARRQFIVTNDGNKTLYLAFAGTATLAAWTVRLPSGATYTSPLNGYTGVIFGIWDNANGAARVTEVTT
jgi:hypothetical protein